MSFKQCDRPCRYRASAYAVNGCNYLLVTGQSRGCRAGVQCTRFEEGERISLEIDLFLVGEKLSEEDRSVKDYIETHKQKIKNHEL